jgi:hypothetical protein
VKTVKLFETTEGAITIHRSATATLIFKFLFFFLNFFTLGCAAVGACELWL